MEELKESKFQLKQFYIKESYIKRNIDEKTENINFGIKPSAEIKEANKTFSLQLNIRIQDKNNSIDLKISAISIFQFENSFKKEDLNNLFYINAPAIVFPYIRAYVATLTGLHGLNALHLPLLNVSSLKDELEKNTKTVE